MLRASELKNKEVINLASNDKLGYICDFEICVTSGEISAVIVPDKNKFFLTNKTNGIRIPWENISGIGDDIVLVNIPLEV